MPNWTNGIEALKLNQSLPQECGFFRPTLENRRRHFRDLFGNRIVWHQLPNGESYSIRISLTKNLGISTVSPVTEHGITINISESSEPSERCRLVNQSVEKGHLGTKNQLEHWNSCWCTLVGVSFFKGKHRPGCCDSTKNRPKQTTSFVIFQCLLRRFGDVYFTLRKLTESDPHWVNEAMCSAESQNLASPYADTSRDLMSIWFTQWHYTFWKPSKP